MPATCETRTTDRLILARPTTHDLDALYAICSDARVWTHFPSLRHTEPDTTAAMIERWQSSWEATGLGTWVLRSRDDARVVG